MLTVRERSGPWGFAPRAHSLFKHGHPCLPPPLPDVTAAAPLLLTDRWTKLYHWPTSHVVRSTPRRANPLHTLPLGRAGPTSSEPAAVQILGGEREKGPKSLRGKKRGSGRRSRSSQQHFPDDAARRRRIARRRRRRSCCGGEASSLPSPPVAPR
jgi:hypothetical protein